MEKMRHNSIKSTPLVSGRGRQNPGQAQTSPPLSLSSSERRGRWQLVRAHLPTQAGERDIRSRHVGDVQGMPSSEEAAKKELQPGAGPALSRGINPRAQIPR